MFIQLWSEDKLESFEGDHIKSVVATIIGIMCRNSDVERYKNLCSNYYYLHYDFILSVNPNSRRCAEEIDLILTNNSEVDFWLCAAIVQILRQFKKGYYNYLRVSYFSISYNIKLLQFINYSKQHSLSSTVGDRRTVNTLRHCMEEMEKYLSNTDMVDDQISDPRLRLVHYVKIE